MSTREQQKQWVEDTEWVTWEPSSKSDAMAVSFKDGEPEVRRSVYDDRADIEAEVAAIELPYEGTHRLRPMYTLASHDPAFYMDMVTGERVVSTNELTWTVRGP